MICAYRMCFPGGKPKCVTLSYDDGVKDDFKLCELMEKYRIAGTFNINTRLSEGGYGRRAPLDEIMKLYMSSELFEVATHGATHPFLERLPQSSAAEEILTDRRIIEQKTGMICRGHAFPYGTYSKDVLHTLKTCGIVYARTVKSTHDFNLPENWLELHPTCHHKDPQLLRLADAFLEKSVSEKPLMFYLWGHTYEFSDDDNWDVIEEFFKKVSGNSDIWYATNIQVYDYVQAFESLVYSADGRTIYNPSATDVWVCLREFDFPHEKNYHTERIPAGKAIVF